MAKGDHKRAQDMIYRQEGQQNQALTRLDDSLYRANDSFQNSYDRSAGMQIPDYQNIMGNYQSFFNNPWSMPGGMPSGGGNQGQNSNYGNYREQGGGNQYQLNSGGNGEYNQSRDPAYVEQQLRSGWQQRYGTDIPQDELDKNMKYVLTPDTYTGGAIRAGWSPYWQERFFSPGHEGSSGADQGGDSTLLGYDQGNGYSGGNARSMFQGAAGIPGWGGWGEGDWGNYGNSMLSGAQGGFSNMMANGGYSQQDMQDMRQRAMGPIRSMFSTAMAGLDRNRNMQGGYSPNYAAAASKMNREMGYNMADAQTNVNASIIQDRNHNQLAGMQGLGNLGQFASGSHQNMDQFGANLGFNYDQLASQDALSRDMGAMNARLGALGGMTSMFGTNPGMMETSGNQLLGSGQNLLSGYNQRIGGNQALMNAMLGSSQIPGNFQSAMGNIGSVLNLAAPFINPFGSMFGMGKDASNGGYGVAPKYGATGPRPWER